MLAFQDAKQVCVMKVLHFFPGVWYSKNKYAPAVSAGDASENGV